MADARGTVQGDHSDHSVLFYGLSTCVWCKKVREYLEDESVGFDFVYVDLLKYDERDEAVAKIAAVNPSKNFPTIVIDGTEVVVGFKPDRLKEVLGL